MAFKKQKDSIVLSLKTGQIANFLTSKAKTSQNLYPIKRDRHLFLLTSAYLQISFVLKRIIEFFVLIKELNTCHFQKPKREKAALVPGQKVKGLLILDMQKRTKGTGPSHPLYLNICEYPTFPPGQLIHSQSYPLLRLQ